MIMRDITHAPPLLNRQLMEREELFRAALALPLESRRELATSLLWTLPREEVTSLNLSLSTMLQKDIIGALPPELAFLILAKLDLKDLLNCSLVSTGWRKVCEEQALWALICASHTPPIRPSHPTWADITHHRSLLNRHRPRTPPDETMFEEAPYGYDYDDRYGHTDPSSPQRGVTSVGAFGGGGGGLDPLGMSGGLRRTVWERGMGVIGTGLPTHLQSYSIGGSQDTASTYIEPPISSHLAVPSAKPQANFKHLFIVHHILSKRLRTPHPFGSSVCLPHPVPSGSHEASARPLPKARAIDAISSVKAGGMPGHSEAIYSIALIHHTMSITLRTSCEDCRSSAPTASASTQIDPAFNSLLNLAAASPSPYPSRRDYGAAYGQNGSGPLMSGQKPSAADITVHGREWLLSGSRDKTLRLWQLGTPEPRVVKVFSGGHNGSVLTHSVVEVSARSFLAHATSSKPASPSKGLNSNVASLSLSPTSRSTHGDRFEKGRTKVMAISGGSDGKICSWDIEGNGQPEKVMQAHEGSVLCVRADDERVVSCSKDKTIRLFDVHTLQQLLVIGGTDDDHLHRGAVNAVGLSKEYIISASGDKTLRIWSIATGAMLFCIEAHQRGIASIDFDTTPPSSLDGILNQDGEVWKGTIVTGASDASMKIFHLIERDEGVMHTSTIPTTTIDRHDIARQEFVEDEENRMEEGDSSFTAMTGQSSQAPNPTSMIGSDTDETIQINVENGKRVYLREDRTMRAPCVCPPGLTRLDAVGCRRCGNRGHSELVRSVAVGQDVVVSGSYDSKVKIWDRSSGQHLTDLSGAHAGRIFAVCLDKTKVISSGLDCRINIWDFAEGLDTCFVEL